MKKLESVISNSSCTVEHSIESFNLNVKIKILP